MIGTLINTKLRPGEPHFALIGRDGSAPGLVGWDRRTEPGCGTIQ